MLFIMQGDRLCIDVWFQCMVGIAQGGKFKRIMVIHDNLPFLGNTEQLVSGVRARVSLLFSVKYILCGSVIVVRPHYFLPGKICVLPFRPVRVNINVKKLQKCNI